MIIDCISDLHGHYPELEGGDLLIIAGDLTARDSEEDYVKFYEWIIPQKYKKLIVIPGNHDNYLTNSPNILDVIATRFELLKDSGTDFEDLKIWGSPWTKRFKGMNPKCMAFTVDTDEELAAKWTQIPDDIDILVTHCPPYGILDKVRTDSKINRGSPSLNMRVGQIKPDLHVFGHIHECYGKDYSGAMMFVNASHVNERYEPINKPIRVIW